MDGVALPMNVEKVEDVRSYHDNKINNKGVLMMRRMMPLITHGDLVLRVMALAFTLVAALIAGLDHETRIVPITLITGLPPLRISATAKWQYLSSYAYFVVANAIACSYSAVSLILSLSLGAGAVATTTTTTRSTTTLVLTICDVIMMALLFSANGAAAAVGILALHGNSHAQWRKVCNIFKKFCRNGAASVTISMLGSFSFLFLVFIATLNLHKKSKW